MWTSQKPHWRSNIRWPTNTCWNNRWYCWSYVWHGCTLFIERPKQQSPLHKFLMATFIWCFIWLMSICDGKTILLHVVFGALVEPLDHLKSLVCVIGACMLIINSYSLSNHFEFPHAFAIFYVFLGRLFFNNIVVYVPTLMILHRFCYN